MQSDDDMTGDEGTSRPSIRLYVDAPLEPGAAVEATPAQANYLINVMRLTSGDMILTFNGRDGEWLTEVATMRRTHCSLFVQEQVRAQTDGPDIAYLFAPLKKARLDYMVQKATEMGASVLWPVMTRRTIAERVNWTGCAPMSSRRRSNAAYCAFRRCGSR